jgi:hypothetical protein
MTKLYFPKRDAPEKGSGFRFDNEARSRFMQEADNLEDQIKKAENNYLSDPKSVTRGDVEGLIRETYQFAVTMFDEKRGRGEALLPQEQEIYNLCKSQIDGKTGEDGKVTSILGVLFIAIERIRDCFDELKEWFDISSDRDKAGMALVRAGSIVLPQYGSLVKGFFAVIKEFFVSSLTSMLEIMALGQGICASMYQKSMPVNKSLASAMLDIADYGYSGHGVSKPGEYTKLRKDEIPADLRVLYDENTGLFTSSRGLQAWLGKKDGNIVIAYSGTDLKNIDMVFADVIQLSSPSTLYLKAAGLLYKMLANAGNDFYVCGHSLGGGLTQFALTANMNMNAGSERLQGYGYNPAGLSMVSIDHLEAARLSLAREKAWMFMTCFDPVSRFGGKIGCLTTLPKTDANGHGMDDLKKCMKKYLETPDPVVPQNVRITVRDHSSEDFIPYTHKLSIRDQGGSIYPIFNASAGSFASDIMNVDIPKPLFDVLNISKNATPRCLGIYDKFNGTAHTVINRLLLMNAGNPLVSRLPTGNIHSSIIFGKYGLGVRDYIAPILEKAYVDSGCYSSEKRDSYENQLAYLENPWKEDKDAWCEGFRIAFGIDMIEIFRNYPYAEKYIDEFLVDFSAKRIDLYQSIYTGSPPSDSDKKKFITGLRDIAMPKLRDLFDAAARYHLISPSQKVTYLNYTNSFCEKIIATY